MLKTNSKAVKKYFDEYMSDILEANFDNDLQSMCERFVAGCSDAKGKLCKKYSCYQEAFKEMTWNYATPHYQEMKEMLMEALNQTEAEANKYSNTEIENKFNYLVYCAYLRKCKAEKINPFQFN